MAKDEIKDDFNWALNVHTRAIFLLSSFPLRNEPAGNECQLLESLTSKSYLYLSKYNQMCKMYEILENVKKML